MATVYFGAKAIPPIAILSLALLAGCVAPSAELPPPLPTLESYAACVPPPPMDVQDDALCDDLAIEVDALQGPPEDWYCVHTFGHFMSLFRSPSSGEIGLQYFVAQDFPATGGFLAVKTEDVAGTTSSHLLRWDSDRSSSFVVIPDEHVLRIRIPNLSVFMMEAQLETDGAAFPAKPLFGLTDAEPPSLVVVHQATSANGTYHFHSDSTLTIHSSTSSTTFPMSLTSFEIVGQDFVFNTTVQVDLEYAMDSWRTVVGPNSECADGNQRENASIGAPDAASVSH